MVYCWLKTPQPVINSIEVDEQSNLIVLFSNDKINLGMVRK